MEDPGSQDLILQFVLLFVLTLLNAFFSATEMSMVSLNRSRWNRRLKRAIKIYSPLKSIGKSKPLFVYDSSRHYLDYHLVWGKPSQ